MIHLLLTLYAVYNCAHAQAPPGVGQANDWLVQDTCNTTTSVKMVNNVLTISNGLVSRSFLTSPAFCTIEYQRLTPVPFTFLRALTPEGNLTLNYTAFNLGGCLGVPLGHAEFWNPDEYLSALRPDPDAFMFESYSLSAPEAPFPWVPGTRGAPSNIDWPPKGVHLTIKLRPPLSANYTAFAGVTPLIHYEMYDCVPALKKWIEVSNASPLPVLVDAITTELLRAPNGAPEMMTIFTYYASGAPWDDQIVPDPGQQFPARTSQLWHWDRDYDNYDDNELHASWTFYTYLIVGYHYDLGFGGPTGPFKLVLPQTTFEALPWRFVLHDSLDLERKGLTQKRFLRTVAPQTYEAPTTMMTTNINSTEQFRLAITQAEQIGIDILIVAYGAQGYCGLCDAQMLNETWRAWFAEQVQFAKEHNVVMSAYTLMQHNSWGETVPPGEEAVGRDGTNGTQACMATDWHARYRQNVLDFIKNVSLGGLETDGEYEGYACSADYGDHHHNGVNGSFSEQLLTTLDFNINLKKLGVYQTSADAYVWSGVNRWNFADTDAGFNLPFWEFLSMARNYVYDSTFTRTPGSGQYLIFDMTQSTFDNCGGFGLARMQCLNFAVGSLMVSGAFPVMVADTVYQLGDSDAAAIVKIYGQWYAFYKKYRPLLSSDLLLHVGPVTSRTLEITLHARRNCRPGDACVMISVVNPTTSPISQVVPVTVYYSGIKPGSTVTVVDITPARPVEGERLEATDFVVGAKAGIYEILLPVTVAPRDFQALLLSAK